MQPAPEDLAVDKCPVIVGVGASAGGLEAFTELLRHLPDDTGMAFVLIQHLDPRHESHLTELLSKASKMPVTEVRGETRAEANHVYVIAPRCNLGISDGVLQTPPRPASGRNMPIDSFLAQPGGGPRQQGARRGSVGNRIGRDAGPSGDQGRGRDHVRSGNGTAKFDSMPRSAIAAGVADFVLPPAGIARQLVAIAREPRRSRSSLTRRLEPPGDAELAKILRLVRIATGVDFTHYKHGTLARRIKRRMALRGFETLEDYSRDLEQNREEATALCESCFITVTAFFREPAVFEELKRTVFPALVENRAPEDPIRIWVPGCAIGRGSLFHRHLPDGIPGRGGRELSVRDFRHRYQPDGDRKGPRRHLHRRRVGPCFAAAAGAVLHARRNAGTRSPRASATYAFLPGTTWRRTRPSPSWTSSVAATC